MTFLNVFIAVLLCLAALVTILLTLPLSLRIKYCNGTNIFAGIGPAKFKVYPSKDKKKDKKKKADVSKKTVSVSDSDSTETKKRSEAPQKTPSNDKGSELSAGEILEFAKDIIARVANLFSKRAKIRIDTLKVVVSKPDAADTAIQFGICSGIVSGILAFTSAFGKSVIKDKNISVEPDFISGKSRIETDITLSVRVCFVLLMLLKMLLEDETADNKSTKKGNKK